MQIKAIAERESTIKTAAELHTKVLWWSEIADALSPTGIPAEILQSALSPVNELLTELSKMAGWKEARITGDIEITYGERLYGLLSESEKWRTDTLLSIAVASLSGLKFVTLDRFDVLEPAARPQALKLLLQCASKASGSSNHGRHHERANVETAKRHATGMDCRRRYRQCRRLICLGDCYV